MSTIRCRNLREEMMVVGNNRLGYERVFMFCQRGTAEEPAKPDEIRWSEQNNFIRRLTTIRDEDYVGEIGIFVPVSQLLNTLDIQIAEGAHPTMVGDRPLWTGR